MSRFMSGKQTNNFNKIMYTNGPSFGHSNHISREVALLNLYVVNLHDSRLSA